MSYFDTVNVSNLLNPHPVTASGIATTLRYLPTLDAVHYHIHQGEMFHTYKYFEDVADAGTAVMFIKTSAESELHMGVFVNAGGSCKVDIHEGTTVSGNGTPTLVHNFNTVSPNATGTATYDTPTITSDGLKVCESGLIARLMLS